MNIPLNYLDRPVFICGYHKSGTTLFLSILDGHPELVVIPEEFNFFQSVLFQKDKAKAIREKSGFKLFLSPEDLPEWSHGRTWYREGYPEFNHEQFTQLFEAIVQRPQPFKDLMLQMVDAYARVDRVDTAAKRHWVSKTPLEEIYYPVMRKMFGKHFKFIYVVRDPRDVFTSVSKWKANRGKDSRRDTHTIIQFCINWRTRLSKVQAYQKKHQNVCILRYEDLLLNTQDTLKQICSFLEIGYSDELLDPTRHGKEWEGNSAYSEGFKGLSQEPVGRYQKVLQPEQVSLIEQLLGDELASLGYNPSQSKETVKNSLQNSWRDYQIPALKLQLRYFIDQAYIRLRYSLPMFQ